jgi:hypothetical protein
VEDERGREEEGERKRGGEKKLTQTPINQTLTLTRGAHTHVSRMG